MTKTGRVRTMKLVHISGSIDCNPQTGDSYWGCTNPDYGESKFMTNITNATKEAILPHNKDLRKHPIHQAFKEHCYSLEETVHKSAALVFRNLSSPLSLSQGQELQIWYGQDWVNFSENQNSGQTCVDVFAWYI